MKSVWAKTALVTAVIVLLVLVSSMPVTVMAAQKEVRGAILSTDKDEYLPGSQIQITLSFQYNFTGSILVLVKNPDGETVFADARNVSSTTKVLFTYTHLPDHGVGTFTIAASLKGSYQLDNTTTIPVSIGANELYVTVTVKPVVIAIGKVVDEKGSPLEGVTVCLFSGGTKIAVASTNSQGVFKLYTSTPGSYTIKLKKVGYVTRAYNVSLGLGENDVGTLTLPSLESYLLSLEKKLNSLASSINSLQSSINSLSTLVANMGTRLSNVEGKVSTLETTLNTLDQRITDLGNQITALKDQLNSFAKSVEENYATKSYVDDKIASVIDKINSEVSRLESTINDLKTTITNIQSTLSGRIDDLNTRLSDLGKRVDNAFTRIDDTNKRIDSVQGALSDLQSSVSTLQNIVSQQLSKTVEDLSNAMKTVQSAMQDLKTAVQNASQLAIIGIVVAVIGLIAAIIAIFLVYKRLA